MSTHKDLHLEQRSAIVLSASVLDVIELRAGALKVFVYLSSRNKGQPFAASIPTIAGGTGMRPRSVISALRTLREHQLITRISGSGNQPNQYGFPIPKREDADAAQTNDTTGPSPGSRPPRAPAATPTQAPAPERITALPSAKSAERTATSPTPTPATIAELIAMCYRPMSAQEFAQLKLAYPNEVVLREKLERFDGVGPSMQLAFFIQALKQFT